ncbi:Golgi membrane exchange factor (Ric1p-Rgp1p) subunit [Lecanicillium sp. MT-2017a]|nr:Golgi membrane exchange factor (Ric1p-Rgp1p) subunit [Lecanicillium sp. MT-2017a]
MPSDGASDIRVFVHWRDQTVFAGEEVKCTVTFKNVARDASQTKQNNGRNAQQNSQRPNTDRNRLLSALTAPLHNRGRGSTGAVSTPPSTTTTRGHRRSALSLTIPTAASRIHTAAVQWPHSGGGPSDDRPGHAHKRSLSIVSIGSTSTVDDQMHRQEAPPRSVAPRRGHNRASSLQILPRGQTVPLAGPQSANLATRHMSSPLYNSSYPPDRFGRFPGSATAPVTPGVGRRRSPRASPNQIPEFHFPAGLPASDSQQSINSVSSDTSQNQGLRPDDANNIALRQKEQQPGSAGKPGTPAARILSSTSVAGGTPRSSGEFYSMSNQSSETLASEYVARPLNPPVRNNGRPPHLRKSSGLAVSQTNEPESIMMGYAQVQGSFTLDGSLVSLGQFDEVKKKAVVGGRGGGVVGLEQNKKEGGALRGFGWGAISSSLGDFLGGSEMSTIKEIRGAANSKSIPLLTTPQSILFVDLQLYPGESRSFEYTFKIPSGLPPSHKGKALKITYSLIVGTQRSGGVREQQVRSVDIPFRVLGSVNSHGEVLGHDLMSPYVLLRDEAQVKAVGKRKKNMSKARLSEPATTMNDFLTYVDDLVAQGPDGGKPASLLSPTSPIDQRRPSVFETATTAKEAIHLAIMRSNMASEGQSQNRFEIARNGRRVGVVMLPRPAYRLGEVVTMVIDFTDAEIPCYAVHATLETSEKIDQSLALRSESSIQRVTRKIYAGSSETTMYSRRVVFTPTIPISATPEFVTSGVSFEWKIRVEFVVPAKSGEGDAGGEEGTTACPLLEQISEDEKGGLVLVAVENLACESFDVSVPLKVYGAVGTGLERLERDESSEEGLVV